MEVMKKVGLVLAGVLVSTAAFGQGSVNGTVTDHYKSVISRSPYNVEVCTEVATSGDRTADTIVGTIIGGVVGHQIDHKDGAKIGGVLGGIIGNQNSDAKGGTRTQCRVETRYNEEVKEVYSHSTITFYNNGRQYNVRFNK